MDDTSIHRAARVARTGESWSSKPHAEGIYAVCGLLVSCRLGPVAMRTSSHWPDDPAHSYEGNSEYFCRGSNEEPAGLLDDEPTARIRVSPETMALLMDSAADEFDGRVTTIAIAWGADVSREDAARLSRAWADTLAANPVVGMTRIRVYGDRKLELVA